MSAVEFSRFEKCQRTVVSICVMCMICAYGAIGLADEIDRSPQAPDTAVDKPAPTTNMMEKMLGQQPASIEPNTVMQSISREAKRNAAQSFMALNPLSLRDMINLMTYKVKADEGLEFDEIVESMQLRANFLNFKAVGHNTPWKVMEGIVGKPVPRVEIFSFCDVMTMRAIMDYSPEFVAFLPCRVSVLEDASGDIWLVTMEWDVEWLDTSPNPDKIPPALRAQAIVIRDNIQSIMQAGATGDL